MPAQDYPEVTLKKETKEKLVLFLESELNRSIKDRKVFEEDWKEIDDLYDQDELKAEWEPFEGSAKLMLPVIATYAETMFSRAYGTLWAPQDPYTAKPLRKEFTEHIRPLRNFMTWASEEELELKVKSRSSLMDLFKKGTCVNKTIYTRNEYGYYEWDAALERYIERIATWDDRPDPIPVPLTDFYFNMEARNETEILWKAHKIRNLSFSQLKAKERSGVYKDVDRLKNKPDQPDDIERDRLGRIGISTSPQGPDKFDIFEIWFEYDIDGDGINEKLVAFFHLDTRTVLRLQHNWFPYQLDPFDICPLVYREYTVYGFGVGHMARAFQKELSAMHNQRLDQGTLANTTMFKEKAGSRVQGPIKIRLGGSITVDEMDDLDVINIGRQYDIGIAQEQHTIKFLEQRLGWQEYNWSESAAASPATSTISMMQEKMRRFDTIIDNIRMFYSSIMTKCLLLYQKYYPEGKAYMLMGDDGLYVEEVFALDQVNFLNGVGIQTTATTSSTSRELERQAKLSVFNLLSQYYGQIEQRFIAAQNPQVPPAVKQVLMGIVVGLSEFVLEILEDFNIRIADRLTVNFQALREAAIQQAEAMALQGNGQTGGMGTVPGAAPAGTGAPNGATHQSIFPGGVA